MDLITTHKEIVNPAKARDGWNTTTGFTGKALIKLGNPFTLVLYLQSIEIDCRTTHLTRLSLIASIRVDAKCS
jgi:hypothetical protein